MKYRQANLLLETHMREIGLAFVPEYRFHPKRMWRFDYAILNLTPHVAVEIEGGTWMAGGGRHNRGAGMQGDVDKYNQATKFGWRVVRFTTMDVMSGKAREFLRSWLCPGVKR